MYFSKHNASTKQKKTTKKHFPEKEIRQLSTNIVPFR